MDFKAEVVGDKVIIKAITETKINEKGGTDVIVHVPSFPLIKKLTAGVKDGVRNIQQI